MKKLISYFFQSILVYIFFILGKITGLRISRIFFSKLFLFAGKFFKSEKINEELLDSVYESVQNFVEREIVEESEIYDDLPVENFESNNNQGEEE